MPSVLGKLARRRWPIYALSAMGLVLLGLAAWSNLQSVGMLQWIDAIQQRRERTLCMNNLMRIAQALDVYAQRHGHYPPAVTYNENGKPLHSWRVLILPELGEQALYNRYNLNEPWDSEHNAELISAGCPKVFLSPARSDYPNSSQCSYFLIVGSGTLFPANSVPLSPRDIGDGAMDTLLLVESNSVGNEWTQPIDIPVEALTGASGKQKLGGTHLGGATAVFADGTPAWLPNSTPPEVLRSLVTPNAGENIDSAGFTQPASQ
ncbi:MAG: DUF1559 domain-containing protein [Pirellulaceae bacterium]|nr:DUF1559 domain-containing protein [Pirellulaceae bacterium]